MATSLTRKYWHGLLEASLWEVMYEKYAMKKWILFIATDPYE